MNTKAANDNADLGKELVQSALGGLGLGTGAAGLYYLLNGLRTAELPVPSNQAVGVLPGAKMKKVKKPSRASASPINAYKTAADQAKPSFLMQAYEAIGNRLPKKYPFISNLVGAGETTGAKDTWRRLANWSLAGLGGYAGLSAVNRLADKQRHDDSKDDVEAARQEYFDALTGKSSAHLDAAFAELQKTADDPNGIFARLAGLVDKSFGDYVATPAMATALGTGLIGGTYMYNQTKARARAENLRRAAAARARLAGIQKTPYIDPVELAALTKK